MPLKILLADDSMTAQNMGKKILTEAGHEVTAVSNGAAAAKKIGDKHDLYILDVYMPGYTGIEVCEKIRANVDTAKCPVLLTVGKMENYNPQDGQRVRADGVIIKPFEAADLLATVQKIEKKLVAAAAPPLLTRNATGEYERTMIFTPPQIEEFKDDSYHEWKSDAEQHTDPEHKAAAAEMAVPPPPAMPGFDDTIQITPPKGAAPAMPAFDDTIPIAPPKAAIPATPTFEDTLQMTPPPAPAAAPSAPAFASFDDTIQIPPPVAAAPPPVAAIDDAPEFRPTTVMDTPPAAPAFTDTIPMTPPPAPQASAPPPAAMPAFEDTIQLKRTPEQMNEFLDTIKMPVIDTEPVAAAPPPAMPAMDMAPPPPAPAMDFASAPAVVPPAAPGLMDIESQRLAAMLEPVAPVAAAPAVAPGVEFTSAPKAGHVEISAAPELEVEEKTSEEVVPMRDPTLVTDPTEMAKEFTTKIGVEGAADDDDFEGKVRIPGVTAAEPVAPDASSAPVQTAGVSDFDAQLAAQMSEYDHAAAAPPAAPVAAAPLIPPPEVDPATPAAADQGMTADLVAQMHEAVADMEVATHPHEEEHAPIVAVPSAPPEPITTGAGGEVSLTTSGVDHELASQLAAALGAAPPAAVPGGPEPGQLLSGIPIEESTISGVVARVLERMRPTIVMEVQKELDSKK